MSIPTKIIGILRNVFKMTSTISSGLTVIGVTFGRTTYYGTNGTTELAYIGATSGGAGELAINDSAGVITAVIQSSNNGEIKVQSDGFIGFSNNASAAWQTLDTGWARAAAGVVKAVSDVSGTAAWVQNGAGQKFRSSSTTNITITPATTGLSVTVAASRTYKFKCVLYTTTATAADGLRVDFDGGNATMSMFIQNGILSDTTSVRPLAQTTALATDVTDTSVAGAAMSVFEGTFTTSGAGTFIPRFAKEADAAGATITIQAGSYLEVWDIT